MNDAGPISPLARADIARMQLSVQAISLRTPVDQVADLFLQTENARMLSLPVVDENGQPAGTISRHQLNNIFLRRFGREIFGSKPVAQLMNIEPLVVDAASSLEEAAAYVTANIGTPITEDFIITRDGRYAGMGIVLDLLRALQERVAASTTQLTDAFRLLKASQTRLVQSEKMASLGQMVAGIAHEINTPLGYVRNNVDMMSSVYSTLREVVHEFDQLAQMLADNGAEEAAVSAQMFKATARMAEVRNSGVLEDSAPLLQDTLFGVDQIKDLVLGLKNFSRLDQARTSDTNLNDCLDQTLLIAGNVIKGKAEIIKRYGTLPPVRCSPSQINQVLLNIISNGVQAIEHRAGKLLIKTEAALGWAHISIQDNGKGIAPDNLAKIFDPFFTTKPVGQGTGLGLSISYQIIQAHGGSIKVASQPGKGTRFLISLPVQPAEASAASVPAPTSAITA